MEQVCNSVIMTIIIGEFSIKSIVVNGPSTLLNALTVVPYSTISVFDVELNALDAMVDYVIYAIGTGMQWKSINL